MFLIAFNSIQIAKTDEDRNLWLTIQKKRFLRLVELSRFIFVVLAPAESLVLLLAIIRATASGDAFLLEVFLLSIVFYAAPPLPWDSRFCMFRRSGSNLPMPTDPLLIML